MSLLIECPACVRRYGVDDKVQGKRVRCQQCGNVFTAQAVLAPASLAPSSTAPSSLAPAPKPESFDLLATDLAQLPPLPSSTGLATGTNPLGARTSSPVFGALPAGVSNPSGGPTDTQMRLLSGGMLALGIVLLAGSFILGATQGTVYLGIVLLLPLTFVLGITGLIAPNVVRAVGKYGGHLPWHYKAIGWGVMGLCLALMVLLMVGLFLVGFEPDRPGGRNRAPGLTRSETATVVERIRGSYEKSPDREVVRTVTFPVFSLRQPQPAAAAAAAAEQSLGAAPGYVAGSFRISPDQKSVTFQYRGAKEIAIQYALLLPGPTGIFIEFSPKFEE